MVGANSGSGPVLWPFVVFIFIAFLLVINGIALLVLGIFYQLRLFGLLRYLKKNQPDRLRYLNSKDDIFSQPKRFQEYISNDDDLQDEQIHGYKTLLRPLVKCQYKLSAISIVGLLLAVVIGICAHLILHTGN